MTKVHDLILEDRQSNLREIVVISKTAWVIYCKKYWAENCRRNGCRVCSLRTESATVRPLYSNSSLSEISIKSRDYLRNMDPQVHTRDPAIIQELDFARRNYCEFTAKLSQGSTWLNYRAIATLNWRKIGPIWLFFLFSNL